VLSLREDFVTTGHQLPREVILPNMPSTPASPMSHSSSLPAGNIMSWALDEFFASVEDEFGVRINSDDREVLATPGAVIDFLVEISDVGEEMDEEARREHIDSVLGELMAQTLGVTRYREDSRFIEDLHVR